MEIEKYVKFSTMEAALAYLPILQAHVDANYQEAGKPKIHKGIVPTYDGKHAIPLPATYPETTGEVVDSIEPPVVEMPEMEGL